MTNHENVKELCKWNWFLPSLKPWWLQYDVIARPIGLMLYQQRLLIYSTSLPPAKGLVTSTFRDAILFPLSCLSESGSNLCGYISEPIELMLYQKRFYPIPQYFSCTSHKTGQTHLPWNNPFISPLLPLRTRHQFLLVHSWAQRTRAVPRWTEVRWSAYICSVLEWVPSA